MPAVWVFGKPSTRRMISRQRFLMREMISFFTNPPALTSPQSPIANPQSSEPGATRTRNLQLRRLLLYPVELRARTEVPAEGRFRFSLTVLFGQPQKMRSKYNHFRTSLQRTFEPGSFAAFLMLCSFLSPPASLAVGDGGRKPRRYIRSSRGSGRGWTC
jgi:hypothetical protein